MATDAIEWLEADGLGGFASGTSDAIRTRRYHALLLVATTPPTGRYVLVNGFDAFVETQHGTFAISAQRYGPDTVYPDGVRRIEAFVGDPWPRWTYRLDDGTRIEHEVFVPHGSPSVVLAWRVLDGASNAVLTVRPFLSGRDYHALHHENPAFRFDAIQHGQKVIWHPYAGVAAVHSHTNGQYLHKPDWYRNFLYTQERERGLDCAEDLATPGILSWQLARGAAVWILTAGVGAAAASPTAAGDAVQRFNQLRDAERARRARFASRLHRAADAYIVQRDEGKTVVAGYPWFIDWGRDTFISLPGLCLLTGRPADARDILLRWAATVSRGMLPNRFCDSGEAPEYNSVDASLWFIIAVHAFFDAMNSNGRRLAAADRSKLDEAVDAILAGYAAGTRYGIRLDEDGLLAAGTPGVQLTWMDAKVGDWVVTPRIGKPVEVQCLWLNALSLVGSRSRRWADVFTRGRDAFVRRFWNAERGYLFDNIDVDHKPGTVDGALRPNQIFAVGGLPQPLLSGDQARRVVDAVEAQLWTPLGLRSLAPGEPGYTGHYAGGVRERDGAYHQGTVWPWLIGAFVDAWIRVRGGSAAVRTDAQKRFLTPLLQHLDTAGFGHVSEIADGDPPHTPRGCPFQAWSVAAVLCLQQAVADRPRTKSAARSKKAAAASSRPARARSQSR